MTDYRMKVGPIEVPFNRFTGEWVPKAELDAVKARLAEYEEALKAIADKDAWREKYPGGEYHYIAVEAIGIATRALTQQP